MELPVDNRPLIARFMSPKAARIVAENGTKCQNFEAGETARVHRDLFAPAIAAGLVPVDSLEAELEEPEKPPVVTEESVFRKLVDVVTELIARGNPADFTTVGQPKAAVVKKLVDFNFTADMVRRAFDQAMHEVEQDGSDSKEHSESGSVATE